MSDTVLFADVHQRVDDFKRVLADHGLTIEPGSELDIACDATAAILLRHWDPNLRDPHADIRDEFRDALALYTFTKKLVKLQAHPDFDQLRPHLKTMATKGGLQQNQWSSVRDQVTPKIFELLIALAVMDVGSDVRVDDPDRSKGDNPDVIGTIEGVRWGFACKLLNTFDPSTGPKPKTLFDNLEKGVRQIDSAPDVERGLVIVSIKNAIPHDDIWPVLNPEDVAKGAEPIFGAALSVGPAVDKIRSIATSLYDDMEKEIGADEILKIFKTSKARPGLTFFVQTVASVVHCGTPAPTHLLFLHPETDEVGTLVCDKLNRALQDH